MALSKTELSTLAVLAIVVVAVNANYPGSCGGKCQLAQVIESSPYKKPIYVKKYIKTIESCSSPQCTRPEYELPSYLQSEYEQSPYNPLAPPPYREYPQSYSTPRPPGYYPSTQTPYRPQSSPWYPPPRAYYPGAPSGYRPPLPTHSPYPTLKPQAYNKYSLAPNEYYNSQLGYSSTPLPPYSQSPSRFYPSSQSYQSYEGLPPNYKTAPKRPGYEVEPY